MSLASSAETDFADHVFDGEDVAGEVIQEHTFDGCLFRDCAAAEVRFVACRFSECVFEDCDVSVMRLTDSRLLDTAFVRCKAIGVDWSEAAVLRAVRFDECVLDMGSFLGLDLTESQITDCRARDARFEDSVLKNAKLAGTDFDGASFVGTDLRGADLRGAINYAIDPVANKVRGVRARMPDAIGLLHGLGVKLE